jgi:hypothetical protein
MKKVSNKEALRGPCVLAADTLGAVDGGASRGGGSSGSSSSSGNSNRNNDNGNGRNDSPSATDMMTGNNGGSPGKWGKGEIGKVAATGLILGGGFWATGELGNTVVNGDPTQGPGLSAGGGDRFATY